MELLVLGDIHGRNTWKEYTKDINTFDKVIFLGDYVDDFTKTDEEIILNLKEIINFKKSKYHKVELLLGNHDMLYYTIPNNRLWRCSGYRETYALQINQLFQKNKNCFKPCYQLGNWFFSHAGLNKGFLKNLQKRVPKSVIDIKNKDYATYINEIFKATPNYLADISYYRGGNSDYGGPFWADLREFSENSYISKLNQVCGHQPVEEIQTKEFGKGKTKMIWIDTESHPSGKEPSKITLQIGKNG